MQNRGTVGWGKRMAPGATSSTGGIHGRLYLMQNDTEAIVSRYLPLVKARAFVRSPSASFLINMCNSVCVHT